MLISFSAEPSEILDSTLKDFESPQGVVSGVIHMWLFGMTSTYRLDNNLVIVKTDGIIEMICRNALIMMGLVMLLGFILNNQVLMYVNLPFMFLAMIIIDPKIHTHQLFKELKSRGYKGKLKYVGYFTAKNRFNHVARDSN